MLVNLNDILKDAKEKKYAVGAFNCFNLETISGIIKAAEEVRSPVIIQFAPEKLQYNSPKNIAPIAVKKAKEANVPVCIHFDHGEDFREIMQAIYYGSTSVMIDASLEDYDENVRRTQEVVKVAHSVGVSVEAEIGHVGTNDKESSLIEDKFTKAEHAVNFVKDTNVDALAVAIGTSHGNYNFEPKLNIERLRQIRDSVDVPLVMHGGSGLSDEEFRKAIENGICKINICTDILNIATEKMREMLNSGYNYIDCYLKIIDIIAEAVKSKMVLFGSADNA